MQASSSILMLGLQYPLETDFCQSGTAVSPSVPRGVPSYPLRTALRRLQRPKTLLASVDVAGREIIKISALALVSPLAGGAAAEALRACTTAR